jgi:hypothetical protein
MKDRGGWVWHFWERELSKLKANLNVYKSSSEKAAMTDM